MLYNELVAEVVTANRQEIEADLAAARAAYDRANTESRDLSRTVAALEWLLETGRAVRGDQAKPAGLTLHEAMREVLRRVPMKMMRAQALASEIDHLGLYRMRDGRPVEAQQIHARTGNYPDLFEREGTFIRLK